MSALPDVPTSTRVGGMPDGLTLHLGDNLDVLAQMPADSIDAVVTDPPYGLSREPDMAEVLACWLNGKPYKHRAAGGMMGRKWDAFVPGPETWRQVLRVLKPGGHVLAASSTRTADLQTLAMRLAGFEIRDQVAWISKQGFPKSHDIAAAIDRAAGATREVVGTKVHAPKGVRQAETRTDVAAGSWGSEPREAPVTVPATDEAKQWDGWGTALKPAVEPWVLARKPLSEPTIAANVLRWGTGGLNIDGCRIDWASEADRQEAIAKNQHADFGSGARTNQVYGVDTRDRANYDPEGRWPANTVTMDDDPSLRHFRIAGAAIATFAKAGSSEKPWQSGQVGKERCSTCGGWEYGNPACSCDVATWERNDGDDIHPTVKPLALMRYLVRLVCPDGGVVLDPFAGTGTTGEAALVEGFEAVLIEQHPPYVDLITMRVGKPMQPVLL